MFRGLGFQGFRGLGFQGFMVSGFAVRLQGLILVRPDKTTRNETWSSICPCASLQQCLKTAQKVKIGQT